jgi:hypothetical protein
MTKVQLEQEQKYQHGKQILKQMAGSGLLKLHEYEIARAKLQERFKPILA